jgi:ketosteroid isomerase-like protein
MNEARTLEIAKRLIDAITAGDVGAVEALYHEDLTGWQNFSGRELNRRQMLKIVRLLTADLKDLRYDDIRVTPTARGYVQQHVLRATAPDGRPVVCAACLVVEIEDGRIRRIDEYMDGAALAPLLTRAPGGRAQRAEGE